MSSKPSLACIVLLVATATACESSDEREKNARETIASATPAPGAPSVAEPTPHAEPSKPIVRRPAAEEQLVVTDELRARLENQYPQAAGFITGAELEEKLYAQQIPRGKDDKALKALDKLAADHWILVTGHITDPKPDGFTLAVRYTPRDPADPMGLTSQWIPVRFTGIDGYDASEYRPGEKTAVLAKYTGNKDAKPGYDLILLRRWYAPKAE